MKVTKTVLGLAMLAVASVHSAEGASWPGEPLCGIRCSNLFGPHERLDGETETECRCRRAATCIARVFNSEARVKSEEMSDLETSLVTKRDMHHCVPDIHNAAVTEEMVTGESAVVKQNHVTAFAKTLYAICKHDGVEKCATIGGLLTKAMRKDRGSVASVRKVQEIMKERTAEEKRRLERKKQALDRIDFLVDNVHSALKGVRKIQRAFRDRVEQGAGEHMRVAVRALHEARRDNAAGKGEQQVIVTVQKSHVQTLDTESYDPIRMPGQIAHAAFAAQVPYSETYSSDQTCDKKIIPDESVLYRLQVVGYDRAHDALLIDTTLPVTGHTYPVKLTGPVLAITRVDAHTHERVGEWLNPKYFNGWFDGDEQEVAGEAVVLGSGERRGGEEESVQGEATEEEDDDEETL